MHIFKKRLHDTFLVEFFDRTFTKAEEEEEEEKNLRAPEEQSKMPGKYLSGVIF